MPLTPPPAGRRTGERDSEDDGRHGQRPVRGGRAAGLGQSDRTNWTGHNWNYKVQLKMGFSQSRREAFARTIT